MSEFDSIVKIRVTWSDPNTGEQQLRIGEPPLTIGRHSESDIILLSDMVSRHHARLEATEEGIVLVHLSATNRTYVDGELVTDRVVLRPQSSVEIRPFELNISAEPSDAGPASLREYDEEATAPSVTQQIVINWTKPGTHVPYDQIFEVPASIGRDADNTIVLEGEDVSRHHAAFEVRNGELWVADSKSRNGTFVNGARVERQRVYQGDTVGVGGHSLTLKEVNLPGGQRPASEEPLTLVRPSAPESAPEPPDEATVVRKPDGAGAAPQPAASPPASPGPSRPSRRSQQEENTLIFSENTDKLTFELPSIDPGFPPALFDKKVVPVLDLQRTGIPINETTYLAVGGGLGSFVWVDHLIIYGANPGEIKSIGFEPKPYGRYRRLCANSQIPEYERLRSNSDSCPDNIWGWPGYAVREAWHELATGNVSSASRALWQIFGEPTFIETYTPKSGNVFASIDREAARIGWANIWGHGRVKAIRQTDDGRYVVAYTQIGKQADKLPHRFTLARHVHLSLGYPAIRLLPDLYQYRQETQDFKSVVNAYEEHDHVYDQLRRQGGVVLVRGRGIVASRIIQRLYEMRQENPGVAILHLMRTPLREGNRYGRAQREVNEHWELQPFNWPKACWSGDLRQLLEQSNPEGRKKLLTDWGGTTTADRVDWQEIINQGLREGWYRRDFGAVKCVKRDDKKGKVITTIQGRGDIQSQIRLEADFVIDATGLESNIDANPLLKDLMDKYSLPRNPLGRIHVENDFEMAGMRNGQGRMYAAGVITLGGPYAAVDSFLGLQYAAQRSVDSLVRAGAPGLHYLDGLRSVGQWIRWARGVQP